MKSDSLITSEERKVGKSISGFAKYPVDKYNLDTSMDDANEFKDAKKTASSCGHKLSFDIEEEFGDDDTQEILKAFEVDSIQDDQEDNGDDTQDIVSAFEKPTQQITYDDADSVYAAETQVPCSSNDEMIFKKPLILPKKSPDDIYDAQTQVYSPVQSKSRTDITCDSRDRFGSLRKSKDVTGCQFSIHNDEMDSIFDAPTQVFSNVAKLSSELNSMTKVGDGKCVDSSLTTPLSDSEYYKDICDVPTQVFNYDSPKRDSTEKVSCKTSFPDEIYDAPTQVFEPFTTSNRRSLNKSNSSVESEKNLDQSKLNDNSSDLERSIGVEAHNSESCGKTDKTKKLSDSSTKFSDCNASTQIFDQSNCDLSTQIFNKSDTSLEDSPRGEATLLFNEEILSTSSFLKTDDGNKKIASLTYQHTSNDDDDLDASLDDAEATQVFDTANFALRSSFTESKMNQFTDKSIKNEDLDNDEFGISSDNESDISATLLGEEQGEIDSDPPSPSIIPSEETLLQNDKSFDACANPRNEYLSSSSDESLENFPVLSKEIRNESNDKINGETANTILVAKEASNIDSFSDGSDMSKLKSTAESDMPISSTGVIPICSLPKQNYNFEEFSSKIKLDNDGKEVSSEFGCSVKPDETIKLDILLAQNNKDCNSYNDSHSKYEPFGEIKTESKEHESVNPNISIDLSNEQITMKSPGGMCDEKEELSNKMFSTLSKCNSMSTKDILDEREIVSFSLSSDKSFDGFLSGNEDLNRSSKVNSTQKCETRVQEFGQLNCILQNKKEDYKEMNISSDFKRLTKNNDPSGLKNSASIVGNEFLEKSSILLGPLNPLMKEENNTNIKSLCRDEVPSCSTIESVIKEKDTSHISSYNCISTNKENIFKFLNQPVKISKGRGTGEIIKKEEKLNESIESVEGDYCTRTTRARSSKRTNTTEPVITKTRSGRLSKASTRYSPTRMSDVNTSSKNIKKRSLEQSRESTSSNCEYYYKKKTVDNEMIISLLEQPSPILEEITNVSISQEKGKEKAVLTTNNLISDRVRNQKKDEKSLNKLAIKDVSSHNDGTNIVLNNSNSIGESHSRQLRYRADRRIILPKPTRRNTRRNISDESNDNGILDSKGINLDNHVDDSTETIRSTRSKTTKVTPVSNNSTMFSRLRSSSDIVLQDDFMEKPKRSSRRKKDLEDIDEIKATSHDAIPCVRSSKSDFITKQEPQNEAIQTKKTRKNSRKMSNNTQDSGASSVPSICLTVSRDEVKSEPLLAKNTTSLRSSSRKEKNVSSNVSRSSSLNSGSSKTNSVERLKAKSLKSTSPVSTRSVRSSFRGVRL